METNHSFLRIFLIAFMVVVFVSCNKQEIQKEQIQALIEEEVIRRFEKYRAVRLRRCQDDIYEYASEIADSLLLIQARQARDTSGKPPVPIKPDKPVITEVTDTTPIAPFLELDSLR